jgi:hypothetical protein
MSSFARVHVRAISRIVARAMPVSCLTS